MARILLWLSLALLSLGLGSIVHGQDPSGAVSAASPAPTLTVAAPQGQSATLWIDLPLGKGDTRQVRGQVTLRILSGQGRVELVDPTTGEFLARSGTLAVPQIAFGTEYEVAGEGLLSPKSNRLRIQVVVESGSIEVTAPSVTRLATQIEAENLGDIEAVRAAAAALAAELSDLPQVDDGDHAATCNDPTHNHGPGGHTHSHPPAAPEKPSPQSKPSVPTPTPAKQIPESEKSPPPIPTSGEPVPAPGGGAKPGDTPPPLTGMGIPPVDESQVEYFVTAPAADPLRVVTTLPILASVARAIGGSSVSVSSLSPPGVDPHDVRMTPALTAALQRAELFIENGMGLEAWTARAVAASENAAIVPGGSGHAYATNSVAAIEIPTAEEIAAGGHVHAAGNPHAWLSPLNVKVMAANIEAALSRSRPELAQDFALRSAEFQRQIDERLFGATLVQIIGSKSIDRLHRSGRLIPFLEKKSLEGKPMVELLEGWVGRARALESNKLITYHRTWSHLAECLGLEVVATIEEKPGIPPSPAHLTEVAKLAVQQQVSIVAAPPYYPRNRIDSLAQRIGGRAVVLPTQPGESEAATDTFSLFEDIVRRLESAQ